MQALREPVKFRKAGVDSAQRIKIAAVDDIRHLVKITLHHGSNRHRSARAVFKLFADFQQARFGLVLQSRGVVVARALQFLNALMQRRKHHPAMRGVAHEAHIRRYVNRRRADVGELGDIFLAARRRKLPFVAQAVRDDDGVGVTLFHQSPEDVKDDLMALVVEVLALQLRADVGVVFVVYHQRAEDGALRIHRVRRGGGFVGGRRRVVVFAEIGLRHRFIPSPGKRPTPTARQSPQTTTPTNRRAPSKRARLCANPCGCAGCETIRRKDSPR